MHDGANGPPNGATTRSARASIRSIEGLGPKDNGRSVDADAGDRLVIALPETVGTGYRWSVEGLPPGTRVLEDRYDHEEGTPLGTASLHVLVLEVGGEGAVRLRLSRSWKPDKDIVERWQLTVGQRPA